MENLELFEGVARWLAGLVETPSYDVNIWFVLLVLVVGLVCWWVLGAIQSPRD